MNEVVLRRHPDHPGGTLNGRFDDAAMFTAIATVLDTGSRPVDAGDDRTPAQRHAAALADACASVLDHGELPTTTGQRPHLTVTIGSADLEHRTRSAVLDLGGTLSPTGLRQLACDARVIPVVLDGAGQPLDIGRAQRTVPEHLRHAVTTRDRGCARCGRPPSWCEVHHVHEWQHGGPTDLDNLVLLCRACHRLIHHAGWTVTLHHGQAVVTPPAWIDPEQRPRPGPPRDGRPRPAPHHRRRPRTVTRSEQGVHGRSAIGDPVSGTIGRLGERAAGARSRAHRSGQPGVHSQRRRASPRIRERSGRLDRRGVLPRTSHRAPVLLRGPGARGTGHAVSVPGRRAAPSVGNEEGIAWPRCCCSTTRRG